MAFENHERDTFKRIPTIIKKFAKKLKKLPVDGYADFGDMKVYDKDVGNYTRQHMRFIDWLDPEKVATAMMYSFSILSKSVEEPDIKNGKWKYFKDF